MKEIRVVRVKEPSQKQQQQLDLIKRYLSIVPSKGTNIALFIDEFYEEAVARENEYNELRCEYEAYIWDLD